jgi:membrane-associated phospholipid phosphatase
MTIAKKKGVISNWDMTNRAERPRIFAIFFLLIVLTNLTFLILGYKQTAKYLLTVTAGFSAAFGITNFWKISIHTFAIGLAVSVFMHFFPALINLIAITLPILIAWTRIRLKRHTLGQTIGGIILAGSVYIYLQIFFG